MTVDNGLPPRKCKLTTCRKEFHPNTTWQVFDTAKCRNKFVVLERKRGLQLLREQKIRL